MYLGLCKLLQEVHPQLQFVGCSSSPPHFCQDSISLDTSCRTGVHYPEKPLHVNPHSGTPRSIPTVCFCWMLLTPVLGLYCEEAEPLTSSVALFFNLFNFVLSFCLQLQRIVNLMPSPTTSLSLKRRRDLQSIFCHLPPRYWTRGNLLTHNDHLWPESWCSNILV